MLDYKIKDEEIICIIFLKSHQEITKCPKHQHEKKRKLSDKWELLKPEKKQKQSELFNLKFGDFIFVVTFPMMPELMLVSHTSPHDA